MLDTLSHLIATYGYIIVAVSILLESAGVPLPGETALLVAAASAGTGQLSIVGVIGTAAVAAIAGDSVGYWVGRRGGRPFLQRYGRYLRLNDKTVTRIEAFFAKHGPKTVFFGRFVSVLRTYSALFAGISHMPYPIFLPYNATGGIVWATLFGMLGYVFGQHLDVVERIVRDVGWGILGIILLLLGALLVWRWLAKRQSASRN